MPAASLLRPLLRTLSAGLLLAAVGCSGNDLTVGPDARGSTVRLEVGQTLVLELPENRSTGYEWNFVEQPEERVLRLVADDYSVDDPKSTGSGGTHTWEFEAIAPGSTSLSMQNYFQTEPDRQGQDPFSIEIVVTSA